MPSLNLEGDRRLQAVFDEAVDLNHSDRDLFFAGFFGKVRCLAILGSAVDDRFVETTEEWLEEVKSKKEKK